MSLLDGIVKTGSVELGHVEFASFLAERMPTGKPFFRNGSVPVKCRYFSLLYQIMLIWHIFHYHINAIG